MKESAFPSFSAICFLVLYFGLTSLCQMAFADLPPSDSEDICRFFPNNTQIRDPDSCNKYITCINFISHYKECTGSTPVYDKDKSACVKTLSDVSSCFISCAKSARKFVRDPISCTGYYYCYDENFAIPGKCPESLHFNVTSQSCIYKENSDCVVEKLDFCAIVKNGVNFHDKKFCHKYYTCTKGKLVSKSCYNEYYSPISGTCEDKAIVNCQEHPVPKEACGTVKRPKNNYFAADEATCTGFFFCAEQEDGSPDVNPQWGQCPPDTFFSVNKQACVDPLELKCDWDRCNRRSITFVTSNRKGCRHYLRCRDGVTVEELSCGNLFFNERIGACTTEIVAETVCMS